MIYKNIVSGVFIERPNRFIAKVLVDNVIETVHVRNTGRCKELLVDGAKVILELVDSPKRKTKYSLIAVYKGERLINMDSNIPNGVVKEALINNLIKEIKCTDVKGEVTFGNSRFDVAFKESDGKNAFLEVKGVTLECNNIALFPDAPTQRGKKHVLELIEAKKAGYNAYIFFLIQMEKIKYFTPNIERDPELANALKLANDSGVGIIAYTSHVSENEITIGDKIKVILN